MTATIHKTVGEELEGPTPGACQNQFRAPLILQGCSPLGLSKI